MSLDPNKTYLEWSGTKFPSSTNASFKAPAGSTIDWGDGAVETFSTASTEVNTHTYTDGIAKHTIVISGLTSISANAFNDCKSLTSITIPDSVKSFGSNAFRGCTRLTSVTIGNSVTSINQEAFSGCTSLTTITIPNSVKRIDYGAFANCSSLTSITIPNSVTTIGDRAFQNCRSLTSVTIPDSVTSIGGNAFSGCRSLKTIILFPETPPTLGSTDAIPTATTIYVQQSSKKAYKAATNWTAFANKIDSNDIYLSLIRFNKKNKEYIEQKVNDVQKLHVHYITINGTINDETQMIASIGFTIVSDKATSYSFDEIMSYIYNVVNVMPCSGYVENEAGTKTMATVLMKQASAGGYGVVVLDPEERYVINIEADVVTDIVV